MFTDITTDKNYPKTLVIRNHEGGAIWQIYHMDNKHQVSTIVEGATKNGFDAITLEDYLPDYEETFAYWRHDVANKYVEMFPDYLSKKDNPPYPYKLTDREEED